MQKIIVNDGIKSSLAKLITRESDIFETNYRELISTLYSPGFFISKKSTGELEDDFKPEIVNDDEGNPTLLKVNIRGKNPARAYINTGKLISLNDNFIFAPLNISTVTVNGSRTISESPGTSGLPLVSTDYVIWLVPQEVEKEPVDYLPNYIIDGETKNLIKEYLVDFLTVTNSSNRQVNVEGIKLCTVTISTTGELSNLVDYRLTNRAYIRPELYDFFIASYIKHDFILTHADFSSSNEYTSFTSDYKLTGSFMLLGGKSKLSKIRVNCSAVTIPVDSVIYITLTENEFFDTGLLTKTLQVTPIADFSPSQDTVVIGWHLKTKIPADGDPVIE